MPQNVTYQGEQKPNDEEAKAVSEAGRKEIKERQERTCGEEHYREKEEEKEESDND